MAILVLGRLQAATPPYAVPRLAGVTIPGLPPVTGHITVDQFGYLPNDPKVAVISDPQKGYNADDHFKPGQKMELRTRDGKTVFSGLPAPWKNGQTDEISGDRGWWFDFSLVKTPGEYYVFDPASKLRSPIVRIGDNVFAPVLKGASRMFYFQREGTPLLAKNAGPWAQDAALTQDSKARSVEFKDDATKERDLSGGWMDAGDTDKYPPFNADVIHPLLYAYTSNPKAFGDANNIPESGNGRPDILDEVKYQLDWLVRMQFPDGALPVKMGNIDYSGSQPLSTDHRTRYYGPKDSGAAIYAAAIFAHASRVYAQFPEWKSFADDLKARALKSWTWFHNNPRTFKTDTGEIKSGIANRSNEEQDRMEAFAAIHLFALTGDESYNTIVKAKAGTSRQLSEYFWSPYEIGSAEALVDYMTLPHADAALVDLIKQRLVRAATSPLWAPDPEADLYRAWMQPTNYHWGSNTVRGDWGVCCLLAAKYGGVDEATKTKLRQRALEMLHSFHGVNPLSVVYLSNMKSYGAELSLMHIYHDRWGFGTKFSDNPPPGYVVGGLNHQVSGKAADGKPSIAWIKEQPTGKSYADFNLAWPESSWELSEPAIYYQAIYIRLLSAFVPSP